MAEITIRDPDEFRKRAESQAGDAVQTYCQVWPMIGEGLTLLKQIAPAIPTIGRFVSFAVDIVQSAGDAAAKALCSDTAGRGDVTP